MNDILRDACPLAGLDLSSLPFSILAEFERVICQTLVLPGRQGVARSGVGEFLFSFKIVDKGTHIN